MIKFFLTLALAYFAYRFFIAPPRLAQQEREPSSPLRKEKAAKEEGEYVDYEEVD